MDSPRRTSPSVEKREEGEWKLPRRSNSNLSSSSTSSDILVASGPAPAPPKMDTAIYTPISTMQESRRLVGEVRDGRLLVVSAKNDSGVDALRLASVRKIQDDLSNSTDGISHTIPDYAGPGERIEDEGDGPNHRGTYSKAYILLHPEVKWVHRGQGRYLPLTATRAMNSPQTQTPREARMRLTGTPTTTSSQARSLRPQRRSSFPADEYDSRERPSPPRRRVTDALTTSDTNLSSARSARRAKPAPADEFERRSSRFSTHIDYDEESEDPDADSDDMARDKEPTFDKEYVDAHPDERFYHTGNGYYKRGRRPPAKIQKRREAEGHATQRRSDGTFVFNPNTTIHVSQLEMYPGVEFHHCGNGWYRAGPDTSGMRASRFGGPLEVDGGEEYDEEDEQDDYVKKEDADEDEVEGGEEDEDEFDEDAEDGDQSNRTVSKAYTLAHPEIEWKHRGKGRYMRKSIVDAMAAAALIPASVERERDQSIYSKAYVEAHPNEKFHHRGNARYMRGSPPEHWESTRRKKRAQAIAATEENDNALFSKAYVDAHPEMEFHHRGQGRYAKGPRKLSSAVPEEESDEDQDGLVGKDYVEAHPNETFHHRGQGRWARGLPPAGASKKVAIRGPGAYDRRSGEEEGDEDEGEKPPPLTALLTKAEGPERWQHLEWHYRGGGKWARVTKQQAEEMLRGPSRKMARPKIRVSRGDGPEAQLEREAAAAVHGYGDDDDDDGFLMPGEESYASIEKPKMKRRRLTKRQSYQSQVEGSGTKASSNSQSQAPTPKPRMLEPEEDILTEEDLPQLYRDEWSPPSEYIDDPAERLAAYMRPLNPTEKFVKALTKFDPVTRPLDNLKRIAENAQHALDQIQREYLQLDQITAPHARIARKVAKGGRVPVDKEIFEDKKEADLYDYTYDPRRLGFQDPEAQKIQRDAEGRELRNRRNRSGAVNGTLPGWNFGEDEPLGPRRAVKPINRFDGIVDAPRKRGRGSGSGTGGRTSKAGSMTPDRAQTPLGGPVRLSLGTAGGTRGRLLGNVPKRIQELRGDSVGGGSGRGGLADGREGTPGSVRKGRPPGSKNLHKRKDAGIKKGPRKPKVVDGGGDGGMGSEFEGDL